MPSTQHHEFQIVALRLTTVEMPDISQPVFLDVLPRKYLLLVCRVRLLSSILCLGHSRLDMDGNPLHEAPGCDERALFE